MILQFCSGHSSAASLILPAHTNTDAHLFICFACACECRVHMYVCMFAYVCIHGHLKLMSGDFFDCHFSYWTQSSLVSLAWDLCLFPLNPGIIDSRGTFDIGSRHTNSASWEASTLSTESPPQPCYLQNQTFPLAISCVQWQAWSRAWRFYPFSPGFLEAISSLQMNQW